MKTGFVFSYQDVAKLVTFIFVYNVVHFRQNKDELCKQHERNLVMGIKTGKYRHFKGNEYEVLYIAKHSETLEEMVVYRALYGEKGVWVRPASMWDETITRDGNTFKRFEKIDD